MVVEYLLWLKISFITLNKELIDARITMEIIVRSNLLTI